MKQDAAINRAMTPAQWAMLVSLSVLWGGSFFFNGVALKEIPTFTLVVGRVTLAAVVLGLFMKATGQKMPVSRQVLSAFIVMGFLNNVVPFSLIVWGQTHIASGVASILNATTPLFTVLVAHWFTVDEKLNPARIAGIVAGLAGVAFLIGGEAIGAIGAGVAAQIAILCAALSYAFASVWGRRFRLMGITPLATATGQVTASSVMLVPVMLVVDRPWMLPVPGMAAIAALIGIAVLSTAVAYILYFRILASAGATNLALVTFLIPVSAILLGVLLLDEVLLPRHFAGMAMIGLGLGAIDGRPWRYINCRARAGAWFCVWFGAVLFSSAIILVITIQPVSAGKVQHAARALVSIKPIHSLVAGVLAGVEVPGLLIPSGATPHNFTMKPSDIAKLNRARVLFVVSPLLERSLVKARASLPGSTQIINLSAIPGLVLYPVREGGTFDRHDHDHDHPGDEGQSKTHGQKGTAAKDPDHEIDTHIWLDPVNAALIVRHVAKIMSGLCPDASDLINANADRLVGKLKLLTSEIDAILRPLKGKPYVVFHDAYQYFERRFGLAPIGSVTLGTDQLPGARRIMDLRKKLAGFGAACVFSEPQFQPRLVAVIVEGGTATSAVLDPVGASLSPGPELYFKLMSDLADGFGKCLVR